MQGRLYGVSVGPGDPELITLKAVRIMRECDCIGIPAADRNTCTAYKIAVRVVPELADKPVVPVPVPMTTDRRILDAVYDAGCDAMETYLRDGKTVAFLNLGDATLYASYMEIHRRMKDRGFPVEIVNGVPSFCAVAARLGVAIGTGNETVHILPGRYDAAQVEQYTGTRILMKSGRKLDHVKQHLQHLEKAGEADVYAVTDCGMATERVYRDAAAIEENAGYFTTILVKEKED